MTRKFMCLIATATAMSAVTLFAQEPTTKAGEGTLMLEKKTYPLKHALAYETTIDNEPAMFCCPAGTKTDAAIFRASKAGNASSMKLRKASSNVMTTMRRGRGSFASMI